MFSRPENPFRHPRGVRVERNAPAREPLRLLRGRPGLPMEVGCRHVNAETAGRLGSWTRGRRKWSRWEPRLVLQGSPLRRRRGRRVNAWRRTEWRASRGPSDHAGQLGLGASRLADGCRQKRRPASRLWSRATWRRGCRGRRTRRCGMRRCASSWLAGSRPRRRHPCTGPPERIERRGRGALRRPFRNQSAALDWSGGMRPPGGVREPSRRSSPTSSFPRRCLG